MPNILADRRIILGITGSIACYKGLALASKLVQAEAQVDVILTRSASQFITPLSCRSITHRPVVTDLFDPNSELSVEHVALAEAADLIVIAPATAQVIAKIAHGFADDSLTTTILATQAPVLLAPAMDAHMYANQATQANISRLQEWGYIIAGPATGHLASGLVGAGRLLEPEVLMGHIRWALGGQGDLANLTMVVSAGGTQEPIDPVRVITNRSSGKMGYAIAEAARDRGAKVILVAAPTSLPDPIGVTTHHVVSVAEMRESVLSACGTADALIMAAAVSDYRPVQAAAQKIKKDKREDQALVLPLVQNSDFLTEVPEGVLRIGFAAESENLLDNARMKLNQKRLALIVANDITASDSGFNVDTNRVTFLDQDGGVEELPLMGKSDVSHRLLDRIKAYLEARRK